MKTDNEKIVSKEYLEEQFYFYNKDYVGKKQNAIHSNSEHISLEKNGSGELDDFSLSLNIANDNERKENDYLVSSKNEKNTLKWVSPLDIEENVTSEELEKNKSKLLTAKTLNNFKGSENISTVGTITEGVWKGGSITVNGDLVVTGAFVSKSSGEGVSGDYANYTKLASEVITTNELKVDKKATIKKLSVESTDIDSEGVATNNLKVDSKATIGSEDGSPASLQVYGTISATGVNTDGYGNLELKGNISSKGIKENDEKVTINPTLSTTTLNSNKATIEDLTITTGDFGNIHSAFANIDKVISENADFTNLVLNGKKVSVIGSYEEDITNFIEELQR